MQKKTTVSVSILSGKGGVGKSNIALNLGYALHQAGKKALLVDCDMGLANMDVLLGIAPEHHMQDMLLSEIPVQRVVVKIAEGLDLIPANSGLLKFTDIDADTAELLRQKINPIAANYDFVIMDIGAGISTTVLNFGAMTTMRVVIITPEPTSLTDSYALIKVLSHKYGVKDFAILVNQVENAAEGEHTFKRIATATERFLGIIPEKLGYIRSDKNVTEAVRMQKPFVEAFAHSPATIDCHKAADAIRKRLEPWVAKNDESEPLRAVLPIIS